MNRSYFEGSVFEQMAIALTTAILSLITAGIAAPWLFCWYKRWYYANTIIDGQRLKFIGTGLGLLGFGIKWVLISLILLVGAAYLATTNPVVLGLFGLLIIPYGFLVNNEFIRWEISQIVHA